VTITALLLIRYKTVADYMYTRLQCASGHSVQNNVYGWIFGQE